MAQELQRLYAESLDQRVRIFDAGTAGMDVMFQARGSDRLIIVDANSSGSNPGQIFKVPGEELENRPEPSYSLHDFRWDHALYSGRQIYRDEFPASVTVYLVEAETLDYGIGLSETVRIAGDRVVEMLRVEIMEYIELANA